VSLDWEGAHARLRAAQERLDAIDQGVGDFEALLHARSAAIAAAAAEPARAGLTDFVIFSAGGAMYGIDAVAVSEVVGITALTLLPSVPPFYRGLLPHAGIVFPLLDIGPLLGTPAANVPFTRALLFASKDHTVAIGADTVETLRAIDTTAFPAATVAQSAPRAAVSAVTADGVALLDVWMLLADSRLIVE